MLKNSLPDITTSAHSSQPYPLQWVGMEEIAISVMIALDNENLTNTLTTVLAKVNLYVSLDSKATKGIHMSRLYLLLNKQLANNKIDRETIDTFLKDIIETQAGISLNAKLALNFEVLLKKKSLSGQEHGYQSYPVTLTAARINNHTRYKLDLSIPYSSTCPCSAALARQLYSEAIDQQYPNTQIDKQSLLKWIQSEAGSIATPHSQRSFAYLKLKLDDHYFPNFSTLIFQFEKILSTAVQTAVKRQDEQQFAKLNAQNLMFCEDAARRIKSGLEGMNFVADYWFKIEHQESLHAHNAVVIDQKHLAIL